MRFVFGSEQATVVQRINVGEGGNRLFIQHEESTRRSKRGSERFERDAEGGVYLASANGTHIKSATRLQDGQSILRDIAHLGEFLRTWQFLALTPDLMGEPVPQQRAVDRVWLARNGANIAEYLEDIRKRDVGAFMGIVEALETVLPFATDLQPVLTSELERNVYLKLKEQDFDVPGWLLSTGTLRILALLACLRDPNPPSLLVVEEVENGLDPRTLHLLVEEIRAATYAGTTQVILTTHSPYLLDLLDLSHIVVVERVGGQPTFVRPDRAALAQWAKTFSPGQLYTMGRLTQGRP